MIGAAHVTFAFVMRNWLVADRSAIGNRRAEAISRKGEYAAYLTSVMERPGNVGPGLARLLPEESATITVG